MIKSIFKKGGASISRRRLGINTVGIAVVSAAIWTGTVFQIPRIWTLPALAVVFTGAKTLKKYKRNDSQELNLLHLFQFHQNFKFIPISARIPINYPGGVPGIRAPPI